MQPLFKPQKKKKFRNKSTQKKKSEESFNHLNHSSDKFFTILKSRLDFSETALHPFRTN